MYMCAHIAVGCQKCTLELFYTACIYCRSIQSDTLGSNRRQKFPLCQSISSNGPTRKTVMTLRHRMTCVKLLSEFVVTDDSFCMRFRCTIHTLHEVTQGNANTRVRTVRWGIKFECVTISLVKNDRLVCIGTRLYGYSPPRACVALRQKYNVKGTFFLLYYYGC